MVNPKILTFSKNQEQNEININDSNVPSIGWLNGDVLYAETINSFMKQAIVAANGRQTIEQITNPAYTIPNDNTGILKEVQYLYEVTVDNAVVTLNSALTSIPSGQLVRVTNNSATAITVEADTTVPLSLSIPRNESASFRRFSTKFGVEDQSFTTSAQIILATHPVGSIYLSEEATLPPEYIIPTVEWTAFPPGSLYAIVGTGILAGEQGNVAFNSTLSGQLIAANIPPHTHPIPAGAAPGSGTSVLQSGSEVTTIPTDSSLEPGSPFTISRSNTRYFGGYGWRRTA